MKQEKSTITIIIPAFNASKTIEETIKSIEAQTVLPDEVIIVDDGSVDDTKNVVNRISYISKLNIKYVFQNNSGVSVARNRGIEQSCSDIIVFLDADDCISSVFIELTKKAFGNGCDFLLGLFTNDKRKLICDIHPLSKIEKIHAMTLFMTQKEKFHTCSAAYSREIITRNNIKFKAGRKYGEDWEFTTKVMDCCDNFSLINNYVLFYRIHDSSAMSLTTYSRTDAIKAAYDSLAFLKERRSSFSDAFEKYMIPKAIFATIHAFAKSKSRELFEKLHEEYDIKKNMKIIVRSKEQNLKTKCGAFIYLLSKRFFFYLAAK